jgi:serine/threonine protein kinase
MENGSLSDIIEQFGVFPETLAATYIQQVLMGLDFLHKRNIVHKDIKASNVLVSKDGTAKLAGTHPLE